MDEIEQHQQVPSIKRQKNDKSGKGLALNRQWVEMKKVFESGKERFNAASPLSVTGFAFG